MRWLVTGSRAAVSALMLAAAAPAVATPTEPPAVDVAALDADVVRAELTHLFETLAASHFDLWHRRCRAEHERRYRELLAEIDGPTSRREAARLLLAFVVYGDVGHATADVPVDAYVAYARDGGTLLPFDVRFDGERVVVAHVYAEVPGLAPGVELVAVDGEPVTAWVDRQARYTAAERPYMDRALLEIMLPRLQWLDAGRRDRFALTVRADGADGADGVERAGGAGDGGRGGQGGPGGDGAGAPGGAAAGRDRLAPTGAVPPGGRRGARGLRVLRRRCFRGLAEAHPDGVSAGMSAEMARHPDGARFPFEIPLVQPRDGARFEGPVYVLVDRYSWSNATTVAAIVQDYGFGVVIGEETAHLPTSLASSARFTLPRTGIGVTCPKARFVRPSGDEALRGVVPDRAVARPTLPGDDVMLLEALALVRAELQRGSAR